MADLRDRTAMILEPNEWPTWMGKIKDDPRTLLRPSADDVLRGVAGRSGGDYAEAQWAAYPTTESVIMVAS